MHEMKNTPNQLVGESIVVPNFVPSNSKFCQIKVEYFCPITKDQSVLHTYLGWDTKKGFKWTINTCRFGYTLIPTLCMETTKGPQIRDNDYYSEGFAITPN